MPYKRVLEAARRGSVFAIFPPYYLPKQRPYLSEYSVPLYTEETVVYCGKNILISPKPNWPEDYFGLTIGNNDGFLVGGEAFHAAAKQNKLIIENAKGTDVNIRKLIADRIDCYVNDRASIVWSIKQMKKNKKLPYVREVAEGSIISQENGHVAFSKKFDARYRRDFIDKLNAIILDMQKSGDINTIVDNFLR